MVMENWFDRDDDRIDGKMVVIAFVFVMFIVLFVVLFHLYTRWGLGQHARRLTTVYQHSMAQTQPREPPKMGLDPCVIATLPTFVYKHKEGLVECAVCLSAIEEEEMVRLLPNCKHTFHTKCIDEWLHSHSTCPICRAVVEPGPLDEGAESVDVGATNVGGSSSHLGSFGGMMTRERLDMRLQSSI